MGSKDEQDDKTILEWMKSLDRRLEQGLTDQGKKIDKLSDKVDGLDQRLQKLEVVNNADEQRKQNDRADRRAFKHNLPIWGSFLISCAALWSSLKL